jgi:hypothetical protein
MWGSCYSIFSFMYMLSGAAKLVYVSKMTTFKLTQELLISKRNRQYKTFYVSYFPTDKEIPFHIKFFIGVGNRRTRRKPATGRKLYLVQGKGPTYSILYIVSTKNQKDRHKLSITIYKCQIIKTNKMYTSRLCLNRLLKHKYYYVSVTCGMSMVFSRSLCFLINRRLLQKFKSN